MKPPKVTLVSHTQNPIETICALWDASKESIPTSTIMAMNGLTNARIPTDEQIELFKKIIAQRIPVGESIDFVFMLENVSISFREQMVRHRIGVKVGDNYGIDVIPDLADSVWWSQSMRIMDVGKFADDGQYRMAESIKYSEAARTIYQDTMKSIGRAYRYLVDLGVPMEDARDLIPQGCHHRISWKLNLSALQHIIGKRSCWILQASLWHPIIKGMIDELANRIHPVFRELALPPCFNKGEFKGCIYDLENERRVSRDDAHNPCPLWIHRAIDLSKGYLCGLDDDLNHQDRISDYEQLWGRNPKTGEKI